jgi:hypothetical protein
MSEHDKACEAIGDAMTIGHLEIHESKGKIGETIEELSLYGPAIKKLNEATKELNNLRAIFPKILEAIGSGGCTANCTTDFYSKIPDEVRAVVNDLRAENAKLKEQINEMATWPGSPLYHNYPYDLTEHERQFGSGGNALRIPGCAQVGQLKVGDELMTGCKVTAPPREGGNGRVLVQLNNIHWIGIPARIPIALKELATLQQRIAELEPFEKWVRSNESLIEACLEFVANDEATKLQAELTALLSKEKA